MRAARIVKTIGDGRDYPGAKGGAGIAERIISQMPPHDLYVELFAGSAQVWRRKLPARASIVIDSDPAVVAALQKLPAIPGTTFVHGEAVQWLRTHSFKGPTVIYCDPPYVPDTLKNPARRYYRQSVLHPLLLSVLVRLRVPVLLSGYRCDLYDRWLRHWRRIDYTATTRGGPVVESLWLNFDPPFALHDYRFFGEGFRERERIKRKKARWRKRLEKMPPLERAALVETVNSCSPVTVRGSRAPSPPVASGSALQAPSPKTARRSLTPIEQFEFRTL